MHILIHTRYHERRALWRNSAELQAENERLRGAGEVWAVAMYQRRLAGRTMCRVCRTVPGTVFNGNSGEWLCCACAGVETKR